MQYFQTSYTSFINGIRETNFLDYYLPFTLGCILSLGLMALIQIILHELGHLFFGLMSGYHFVSFRICNTTIVKLEGSFHIKRYNLPGSLGQCLMAPKASNKVMRYKLYLFGGVIFNFCSALIFLSLSFSRLPLSFASRMMLLIGSFYGFGFALLNGIPNKKGRVCNDGSNLINMIRDPQARHCGYVQMIILPQLLKGYTYRSLPGEWMRVPEGADLSKDMIGWHKLLEYYYYLDKRLYDKAKKCILTFEPFMDRLKGNLKDMILMEQMFLIIMLSPKMNALELEDKYKSIRKTLYSRKADFHITRIRMAYEIETDKTGLIADRIRKELKELRKSYPYKGEARFCSSLIRELLARAC